MTIFIFILIYLSGVVCSYLMSRKWILAWTDKWTITDRYFGIFLSFLGSWLCFIFFVFFWLIARDEGQKEAKW